MASVYKPTGSKKWRIAYVNEQGKRVTTWGYRDKQATEAKARQLERDAERKRAGLKTADQAKLNKPLETLIQLYVDELKRMGRSDSHFKEQSRLLTAIREGCGWETARSIHSDGLREFLKRFENKAPRTINSYRDALVAFCNWCIGEGMFEDNPVAHVKKARGQAGKKHRPRRAYTLPEFQTLLGATLNHRLTYLVAGLSGLRKRELRLLEKRDLTPIGDQPLWHLRPEIQKGRRFERVPMLPECAEALAPLWSSLSSPTERVFKRMPRTETLHKDLARAKVDRVDVEGRTADFHSFRYFFCTLVGKTLPIQKVRILMRHRDVRTTCNLYMDLGLTDVGEELWRLPTFLGVLQQPGKEGPSLPEGVGET